MSVKTELVPTRALIGFMMFTACLMSHMYRGIMSLNIIAMVEPLNTTGSSGISRSSECVVRSYENSTTDAIFVVPDYGTRYPWDTKIQGLILASFFWGFTVASLPAGTFAERYGATKIIFLSMLVTSVFTILIPFAAMWSYIAVIVCRIIVGLVGAIVFPAVHCLISKWSPPVEKSKFTGALLGGALGTVVSWPLLGSIMEHLGWTWAFYIPGGLTVIWCFIWIYIVSDSPESHPRISDEERDYIIKSHGDSVTHAKKIPPYKEMFLSPPFWALVILHFGHLWGLFFVMTAGPKFMSEVLGYNLGKAGFVAALPYLARLFLGFFLGLLGDHARKSGKVSLTVIRKGFVVFSHFIPGLFLIGEIFIGCSSTLAVTFLTLSLGINGAATVTNLQNGQDLAPNFAGTIFGIMSCIGGTTGFITPMLVGWITAEHSGLYEWHIIFGIGASAYICCGFIYLLIGSAEQQSWNNVTPVQKTNDIEFYSSAKNNIIERSKV